MIINDFIMANENIKSIKSHTYNSVKFGTSGLRGLVLDMDENVCAAYITAFLKTIKATNSQVVAVGIDLRPSSPSIAFACISAIKQYGCQIDYCGTLPTPALALYAKNQSIPAIMVTGSHIPYDRNGIKFYTAKGEISKQDEASINALLEPVSPRKIDIALPKPHSQALSQYIDRYTKLFGNDFLSPLRIGVYEHSSVARDCLKSILITMGATVISLDKTDHFVPIDTEAVSDEDLRKAKQWAEQYQLDSIVTTDGDGDRPLISDENGNWLRGDLVGLLTAEYLNADTVVTPISSNTAIERSQLFSKVVRTKIGSPYVISAMEECAAEDCIGVVGFEANGGFMLGDYFSINRHIVESLPTRDSILPILSVLAMAITQNQPISALLNHLPDRFTASDRLQNYPTKCVNNLMTVFMDQQNLAELFNQPSIGKIISIDQTDGIRLSFSNDEILHIRSSGNAPELRCYAESTSKQRAEDLVEIVLNYAKRFIEN